MEVTQVISEVQKSVGVVQLHSADIIYPYWHYDPTGILLNYEHGTVNLRRLPTKIYDQLKQIVGSSPMSTEYNRQVILSEMRRYAASISWYLYKFEDLSQEQAQKLGVEEGLWMLLSKEPTEIHFVDGIAIES